ncbi:bifunctional 4-hydroxy-2-oxoglutarate aldolase/2-dehydro-3-deoxy-phosphogluconate aldolase [Streptomyces canus]|uniref:bifunctional 4-hydroxy-2-oxoglutarate aldolase/2-dehydro-3-deoxy-phosphogluconate aldolase n=1 Tax=Streptomyces canus TaxID=58343 RepID=UPI00325131B3
MSDTDLATVLGGARLLPVLTVPSTKMAGPLAEALAVGGARCAEVTFRTPGAERVLKEMAAHGGLAVGAGTVLTPGQAERAVAAGARFVVSPGFDEEVVAKCGELGVPVVPGIATATELMRALRAGLDTVKLFPAEPLGGLRTLRALAAPFPGTRFVPTGGIDASRMAAYLADRAVLAVGGSWTATPAHLERGDYDEIRRLTADAVKRSMS